jgi:hypothetical protein
MAPALNPPWRVEEWKGGGPMIHLIASVKVKLGKVKEFFRDLQGVWVVSRLRFKSLIAEKKQW